MKTRPVKKSAQPAADANAAKEEAKKRVNAAYGAFAERSAPGLAKLNCDGKKRFANPKGGELMSYSEAYDAFIEANTAEGKLSARGITKILNLNKVFARVKKS